MCVCVLSAPLIDRSTPNRAMAPAGIVGTLSLLLSLVRVSTVAGTDVVVVAVVVLVDDVVVGCYCSRVRRACCMCCLLSRWVHEDGYPGLCTSVCPHQGFSVVESYGEVAGVRVRPFVVLLWLL